MSNPTDLNGYVFKVKDPNNNWITIPILYQTFYQAYVDYCDANNIEKLSQQEYYTLLQSLGTLKQSLEDYIAVLEDGSGAALPLSSGGTGTAVTNLSELLNYLGLTTDIENTAATSFPTTATVREHVAAQIVQIQTNTAATLAQMQQDIASNITTAVSAVTLESLGITCGEDAPDENTPGTIYIKYSAD